MSSTKIEFAVHMTCESCVKSIQKNLENVSEIKDFKIDLQSNSVVVDSTLGTEEVQKIIESTGRKAVVKGFAGSEAAVAILDTGEPQVQGVVRLIQINKDICVIDGIVDGLKPGQYELFVCECGDLSKGCDSVGEIFDNGKRSNSDRLYGDLGEITAGNNNRANFRIENEQLKLSDIIGRSLVLAELEGKQCQKLVCGIIARSSGLFQNPKTICACDGTTIWDENRKLRNAV